MAPHPLNAPSRPDWFFDRERSGGILIDLGSHQVEQFLYYTGARNARVLHSKIANYNHPNYPGMDDFGDATLVADNGATNYSRVDWFTPDGLGTWGDGRTFILGTETAMIQEHTFKAAELCIMAQRVKPHPGGGDLSTS